jgi:hypothetical protein
MIVYIAKVVHIFVPFVLCKRERSLSAARLTYN